MFYPVLRSNKREKSEAQNAKWNSGTGELKLFTLNTEIQNYLLRLRRKKINNLYLTGAAESQRLM